MLVGSPVSQHGKGAVYDVGKVIRCLHACATSAVMVADDVAVGHEFGLRTIGNPRDGTGRSSYLSSILARHAYRRSDQKAKTPDCTLVGVASLRGLVHSAFRIAADRSQLGSQTGVDVLALRAGRHCSK